MKRCFLFFFLLSLVSANSIAQVLDMEKKVRAEAKDTTEGWRKGVILNFNLTQTSLNNWAAGGQNSLSLRGLLNFYAVRKKGKSVWENYLDLGYGLLKEGKNDFVKTDDRIDLVSKYGKRTSGKGHWYYSGLVNFRTQFTPGYNYPNDSVKISNILAPAYLLLAAGMDYKPNDNFSFFVSPLTYRLTLVNDKMLSDMGAFGVSPGEKTRNELGGYVRMIFTKKDFKAEWLKNVALTTKLDLFSNYLENPENVDVSWENLIAMRVNKFLTVNLNTHLIYDDNVRNVEYAPGKFGARTQFKEIFGVGVTVKL